MSRPRQDKSTSVNVLFQQAQRWFLKRDYKQALKDARVLFRQDPTPAHRLFLEQTALARAQELVRGNLKEQAEAILDELLKAPVTEPSARDLLPEVLLGLGWLDRYPQYKPQQDAEGQARFVAKGVDAA